MCQKKKKKKMERRCDAERCKTVDVTPVVTYLMSPLLSLPRLQVTFPISYSIVKMPPFLKIRSQANFERQNSLDFPYMYMYIYQSIFLEKKLKFLVPSLSDAVYAA